MSVDKVLAERGARYGKFEYHAEIAQKLQDVFRDLEGWDDLPPIMKQSITVICDKFARMFNGDPYYDDNWLDIAGYSKLVFDWLNPEEEEENTS